MAKARHFTRNEVLARGVGLDDGVDDVLRHVAVVGEELLGILGQAGATVAEAGVVVVGAYARIKADAFDNLAGIKAMGGGVGIELIKIGGPNG